MIINNGTLCDDNGNTLSCPLQPVTPAVQQGVGIKPRTIYIRQGCAANCTHFVRKRDLIRLLCCRRKFVNVKTKNEGN
jgi:hypothetical protein